MGVGRPLRERAGADRAPAASPRAAACWERRRVAARWPYRSRDVSGRGSPMWRTAHFPLDNPIPAVLIFAEKSKERRVLTRGRCSGAGWPGEVANGCRPRTAESIIMGGTRRSRIRLTLRHHLHSEARQSTAARRYHTHRQQRAPCHPAHVAEFRESHQ
eukprot:COSAG06_NODE_5252_length_3606_cov_2.515255_2_plen_159_part_00